MVQPLEFSLDQAAARTEPADFEEFKPSVTTIRQNLATAIEDSVTLSPLALALSQTNLLPFAGSSAAVQFTSTVDTVALTGGSQIQALLDEGYSLSQIALEFGIPLAEVESELGIQTFSTAA